MLLISVLPSNHPLKRSSGSELAVSNVIEALAPIPKKPPERVGLIDISFPTAELLAPPPDAEIVAVVELVFMVTVTVAASVTMGS